MHLGAFLQFEQFTDCFNREYQSILDELKLSILKHLPSCTHINYRRYNHYTEACVT